jgi:CRISPR-associated endonuclease Cas2
VKSRFQVGWILCMFDLPTVEREDQRNATRFRNGLLDLGYRMLQESVYARNAVSLEKYESQISAVKAIANKQWVTSERIICPNLHLGKKKTKHIQTTEDAPKQMTFW